MFHESYPEVGGVAYRPGVYKIDMARMCVEIVLTKMRMYGSKSRISRNADDISMSLVWMSKVMRDENPYTVTGGIKPAGLKHEPKSICKDRIIGTRKGIGLASCK